MDSLHSFLATARRIAEKAAHFVRTEREEVLQVRNKGSRDLVTQVDVACEDLIVQELRHAFPTHRFLGEESHHEPLTDEPTWIIDPIDGTTNFVHGLPHVGISIALAIHKKVVLGVVAAPFYGDIYYALENEGAFKNEKRIHTSSVSNLEEALVVTGFPTARNDLHTMHTIKSRVAAVLAETQDLRRFGACSVDLCFIASGIVDAYYETINAWDMAAGAFIVKEAGGKVLHLDDQEGRELDPSVDGKELLVTNAYLEAQLYDLLHLSKHSL